MGDVLQYREKPTPERGQNPKGRQNSKIIVLAVAISAAIGAIYHVTKSSVSEKSNSPRVSANARHAKNHTSRAFIAEGNKEKPKITPQQEGASPPDPDVDPNNYPDELREDLVRLQQLCDEFYFGDIEQQLDPYSAQIFDSLMKAFRAFDAKARPLGVKGEKTAWNTICGPSINITARFLETIKAVAVSQLSAVEKYHLIMGIKNSFGRESDFWDMIEPIKEDLVRGGVGHRTEGNGFTLGFELGTDKGKTATRAFFQHAVSKLTGEGVSQDDRSHLGRIIWNEILTQEKFSRNPRIYPPENPFRFEDFFGVDEETLKKLAKENYLLPHLRNDFDELDNLYYVDFIPMRDKEYASMVDRPERIQYIWTKINALRKLAHILSELPQFNISLEELYVTYTLPQLHDMQRDLALTDEEGMALQEYRQSAVRR